MLSDLRPFPRLLSLLAPAVLSAACLGPVELRAPPGSDSGRDDSGSTGSGDDTGADVGDGGESCGVAQLSWQSKILDGQGKPQETVPAGQAFTIAGRVSNPCHLAVTIELPGSCLVEAFDVIDLASGESDYEDLICLQTASKAEIPPGAYIETLASWSGLPEGQYRATTWFSFDRLSASTTFEVEDD